MPYPDAFITLPGFERRVVIEKLQSRAGSRWKQPGSEHEPCQKLGHLANQYRLEILPKRLQPRTIFLHNQLKPHGWSRHRAVEHTDPVIFSLNRFIEVDKDDARGLLALEAKNRVEVQFTVGVICSLLESYLPVNLRSLCLPI